MEKLISRISLNCEPLFSGVPLSPGKTDRQKLWLAGIRSCGIKNGIIKKPFFSHFKNVYTLDVPSFSYIKGQHDAERALMKEFFESGSEDEQHLIREDFNKRCFDHYKKMKEQFWDDIHEEYDLAMVYFNIADVIGHLNFGNTFLMKMIYQDLDELAGEVQKKFPNAKVLVISDHGMKALGYYGEHTHYSFWSTNWKVELTRPKITAFHDLISSLEKPVAQ